MDTLRKYYEDLIRQDGGTLGIVSLDDAYIFCEKLEKSHYENFPVGSLLIPKKYRRHFYAIYAYCRISDDLGDEYPASTDEKLNAINKFESLLNVEFVAGEKNNPIFFALNHTNREKNIPQKPYRNLLEAFRRDSDFTAYDNKEQLENYCQFSANPVGELVLHLFGNYSAETAKYSDMICTALQLANFWQDISRDKQIGRCYIPKEFFNDFIPDSHKDKEHLAILAELYEKQELLPVLTELFAWTEKLFANGRQLVPLLNNWRLKMEIKAVIAGGETILAASKKLGAEIYNQRPHLKKTDLLKIIAKFF